MNPLYLILSWLILSVVSTAIGMIILGISTPGGEQRPFSILGSALPVIVYGILIISVVSVPFYFKWVKKYWYINLFFITTCIIFIFKNINERNENIYYTDIKEVMVNGKNYEQIIQYFDSKSTKIRSVSFYLNGRRDSTWIIFDKDGKIISQETYINGKLIDNHD